MSRILKFNGRYFILVILLLVIEFCIALFAHDRIIRPYVGDLLVVVLVYCFLKSFLNIPVLTTAISALLFSYAVEISQYYHLVKIVGLQHSKFATIIMGSAFEWTDIIAYTAGIILVLCIEKIIHNRTSLQHKLTTIENDGKIPGIAK